MTTTVRQAGGGDLAAVTGILAKLYVGRGYGDLSEENRRILDDASQAILLAYDCGAVIGAAHAAVRREYVEGKSGQAPVGYLEAVYTEAAYRGRGVARALVAECERWAAQRGCSAFASDCEPGNADGLGFHLGAGFREAGRNIHFIKDLPPTVRTYDIRPIDAETRPAVTAFIDAHWFGTDMLIRGEVIDMRAVDGFALVEGGALTGVVTYIARGGVCEIVSLDSVSAGRGVGTALISAVAARARELGCKRLQLMTTNDNLNAFGFYQKRGFELVGVNPGAIDKEREQKPSIPTIGQNGIPLRDEMELAMAL